MNLSAIREIKLLREIGHPNVLSLLDVFSQDFGICLVFEFMESDLEAVIRDQTVVLTPANIKSLSLQVILKFGPRLHLELVKGFLTLPFEIFYKQLLALSFYLGCVGGML
ncbi:unnamed protein product [Dibothriocephalus latus]|uniref:[RNA-polymerase]-subunit kinase n=1 Tax=Dibothriocephalus latus TaxID=60516 RepID=A0A3P7P6S6_DIBLA|nr:unnamed protein product [Dibothriocephalus latus]